MKRFYPTYRAKSIEELAKAIVVLMWMAVALHAAHIVNLTYMISLIGSDGSGLSRADADGFASRQTVLNVIAVLLLLVTVPVFLTWKYRVARNFSDLGAKDMIISPGWCVGWWFVPIANLLRPAHAMYDLHKMAVAGDDVKNWKKAQVNPLVTGWWVFYIAGGILAWVVTRIAQSPYTLEKVRKALWVDVAASASIILSAWLLIALVRSISGGQAKAIRDCRAAAVSPAAA